MINIKKILLPTDFSEYSQWALKYAMALAKSFDAKLYVLHVFEEPVFGSMPDAFSLSMKEFQAVLQEDERKQLSETVEELRGENLDVEPIFKAGKAYIDIVETAKEVGVDAIVLATHGRKGLSHLVFGSTAEKVVRLAPCPVLTIKHPEHDFVK